MACDRGARTGTDINVAIILGTRPEIIKMAPIVAACRREGVSFFLLHSGQHYSYEMERIFFQELSLPEPKYNLDVGSGLHGEQTGRILAGVEQVLIEERPDIVLVEGDTNTVLAGAVAATKLHLRVGHVEAGLRSGDRHMPEEINRIVADHVADYLFAPTEGARANLLREGIGEEKVWVTGNTIVDAVQQGLALARRKTKVLASLGLAPGGYFLVTMHRQENVEERERLEGIMAGLRLLHSEFGLPLVFPAHPRTQRKLQELGFEIPPGIRILQPVGFLDFLQLEASARLVLTDSGGAQEETCILGVPCVTLRDTTERPETVQVGANLLAGWDPQRILECTRLLLKRKSAWCNPFGDGRAAERIVGVLTRAQEEARVRT